MSRSSTISGSIVSSLRSILYVGYFDILDSYGIFTEGEWNVRRAFSSFEFQNDHIYIFV